MLMDIMLETFFWHQLCGNKRLVYFFFHFMKEFDPCASFRAALSLLLMTVITECQPVLIKLAVPRMSNLFLFHLILIHSLPHHTHTIQNKSHANPSAKHINSCQAQAQSVTSHAGLKLCSHTHTPPGT